MIEEYALSPDELPTEDLHVIRLDMPWTRLNGHLIVH